MGRQNIQNIPSACFSSLSCCHFELRLVESSCGNYHRSTFDGFFSSSLGAMKTLSIFIVVMMVMDATLAADETCSGRCGSFDPLKKCQCDSMCVYYGSCCDDFVKLCPKKTRGDTFEEAEDNQTTLETPVDVLALTAEPTSSSAVLTTSEEPWPPRPTMQEPTGPPADRDAAICSGRSFDAFLQLKNGSVYAFRGEYFFELDDMAVLPGYPKLIVDVWGMPGPVDAAFTRINCHGKSYIFQGRKYWRFEGDVLDEGFPRDISEGFDGIPDDLHAAFAVPAPNHRQKEKAYFFKGDQYHVYEFVNQPTHHECVQMSLSSPSLLFSRYTDLFCDQSLDDLFAELFGAAAGSHSAGPRSIRMNWPGISPPVDAAMVGRVFLSPKATPQPPSARRQKKRKWRKPSRKSRRRQTRQALFDFWSGMFDYSDESLEAATLPPMEVQTPVSTPSQYVYFFKRDQYYRVDLRTKRVAQVVPPYPRSIAKFWLGCQQEDTPDATHAEKR
ncbi:vitronectin b isoform X2 [Syngnathus scovelli]|uniref:vitronectin b isoform X2 n=1 Tax=Syngnathus scovelli TaxID=161590 RepID=UPI002110DE6A|nr:vitronectin b isoform X2 [Syngnathus scovelli]